MENSNYNEPKIITDYNTTELLDTRKFYTCDGRQVNTMEEVFIYNQMYYDRMKIQSENNKNVRK